MPQISFRLPTDEYRLICRIAKESGLTPGQYVRFNATQCANHNFTLTKVQESNAELLRKLRTDLAKTANFIVENMRE